MTTPDLIAALREARESLADIATQAQYRVKDGDELGARAWRIGLVDIFAEARATLTKLDTLLTEAGNEN